MPVLHSIFRAAPKQVLLVFVASILVVGVPTAAAQMETVLYPFCSQANCADGAWPTGNLGIDADGNLYGAAGGGSPECSFWGCGVVFQLTPDGTETVVHSFSLDDLANGVVPSGGLVRDADGNFYGETGWGGYTAGFCKEDQGCGVVFQLSPAGVETVLYSFTGGKNGRGPGGGLILDSQGNLYGTTSGLTGDRGAGTAFRISLTGAETVLYQFGAYKRDGKINSPQSLVMDSEGNLYGTTTNGGQPGRRSKTDSCYIGCGTVFKISAAGVETVLHAFGGYKKKDGALPLAGLAIDKHGNLYGTTYEGGLYGYGTVFEITPSGAETVLHNFTGGTDGAFPFSGLVLDAQGNMYGTTWRGGTYTFGTVYQVTPSGVETVLHSFSGGADGGWPQNSGLVLDDQNNIYGTTPAGGSLNGICSQVGGCGVLFKVSW